jgi:acetyltransferase
VTVAAGDAATFAFGSRDVRLRDGRQVHIRPLGPADEDELLQAFHRLGAEARYMRFMVAVRTPNVERLRVVLASFPEKGVAIAATVPASDGIDIVGAASCMKLPDDRSCEFAITIVPDWGGAGLGRVLMESIIGAARSCGMEEMRGYILAQNTTMLRLAQRMGFATRRDPDDPSVKIATLDLRR